MTNRKNNKSIQAFLYASDRERIVTTVIRMGEMAAEALRDAVDALFNHDAVLARKVILNDDFIDRLEETVDQECLGSIAMRSPGKEELCFVFGVLKIITDLERIGDQAVNIAEKALKLKNTAAFPKKDRILSMLDTVLSMFRHALEAFRTGDREAASALWKQDDEADEIYAQCYEEFLASIIAGAAENHEEVELWTAELWAARHLERAGDHVINIAERVYFIVEGKYFPSREEREKNRKNGRQDQSTTGTL
ncbi:phosphate signaling complex protein PhoU [Aminivibrio sp.]|uniref:phosphate signaling complex protein PhoU n=1 Tax=Aminivibrio sp. TaxID=1872489 RepID=UPI001A4CBE53|nr:phosphate signaling complex protein PhoU [Aminivibrio sp.]MBL3540190.1 phosphate signaling complex protein PhoU [Aminivibrio sp.]MDK2958701.1 phosphate transport system protein [Synergistaceae bacterium]